MADLNRLEELAMGATPGPWICFNYSKYKEWHVSLPIEGSGMRQALFDNGCKTSRPEQDAQFIAAANPTTVLELIAEIRRLRAIRCECGDSFTSSGLCFGCTAELIAKQETR